MRLSVMFFGAVLFSGTMPMNPMSISSRVLFYAGKVSYLTHRLVIPLLILPFTHVVSTLSRTWYLSPQGKVIRNIGGYWNSEAKFRGFWITLRGAILNNV
jgi:hypothetical protein